MKKQNNHLRGLTYQHDRYRPIAVRQIVYALLIGIAVACAVQYCSHDRELATIKSEK